ncbi:hypothetical protein ABT300_09155, partial [Streptomyces sp. NPDC001027]
MTKKTRIRVARIAAGAVIAAGASLTVAGVASATGNDGGLSGLVSTSGGGDVTPQTGDEPCPIAVCTDGGSENGGSGNGGSENGGSGNGGSENGGSGNGGSENGGSGNGGS